MPALDLPPIADADAPEEVARTLELLRRRYGFVPNLYRVFAHAPMALEGYLALAGLFHEGTLSATERNVVLLATSRANACQYCVAVHSTVADMQRDPPAITEALRDGCPIDDPRLEALRLLAEALATRAGEEEAVALALGQGFTQAQILEVVVGVTLKTLSNTVNHLVNTPLDPAFAPRAWSAAS
jgi:uncharacterized peroxidase-related enzyme